MAVPPYWSFGRTDIGMVEVPARVGKKLDPSRKMIDMFVLQAEPTRTPYGIRAFGGGGYWEGFLADKGGLPPNHNPHNWGDISAYVSSADVAAGLTVSSTRLDSYLETAKTIGAGEDEVWWFPNVEANSGEFTPTYYGADPYNPSPNEIQLVENVSQAYRYFAQRWRTKRPDGCYAYYLHNAMLYDGWNNNSWFGTIVKPPELIELYKYRNNRATFSQYGKRIDKARGVYDACDAIVAANYTRVGYSIDRIKYEVNLAMEECHRLRKPGQLIGTYVSPSHLDGAYTGREIAALAGELRRAGCQRMIMWGYVSNTPTNQGGGPERYWSFWNPIFDQFADAFL